MKKYGIIFFAIFLINCQNEQQSISGKLFGKVKTLQLVQLFGVTGFPFPITYNFYYDSSNGGLRQINIDTVAKIFLFISDDTIQMNISDNFGTLNSICKAKVNNNKKIQSISYRDSPISVDNQIYYFSYNGVEIDSMGAPTIYVDPYCDFIFKESNLVHDGLNYIQLNFSHTIAFTPGACTYPQGNTKLEYSNIINTGQLPFQFVFTLSYMSFGSPIEFTQSTLSVDPLYVYGLMGYSACKPNYNLLDQVGDRKYSYLFDENNRVSGMTITDTLTDQVLYQYRLTYY